MRGQDVRRHGPGPGFDVRAARGLLLFDGAPDGVGDHVGREGLVADLDRGGAAQDRAQYVVVGHIGFECNSHQPGLRSGGMGDQSAPA